MRTTLRYAFATVAAVAVCVCMARAAETPPAAAARFRVTDARSGKAFDCQVRNLAEKDAYRVLRLTFPSPVVTAVEANNTIPGDYYLPKNLAADGPRRPAVICLHILNGNFELEGMTCAMLAARGIPAVMIKLPYYGERAGAIDREALAKDPRLLAEALAQGVEDVRRTVDVLAARPEVDPQRIGVVGISMGGILGATVAASEPRLHRTALILAGGDLPAMIAHAREARGLRETLAAMSPADRAAAERALAAVDPLGHAAGLQGRAADGKVLMINAAADEVVPRACTEKLAAALRIGDRVVWLEGLGHYTAIAALPQTLRRTVEFFAADLPPGVAPPPPSARPSPAKTWLALAQQAVQMVVAEPPEGRCHFAALEGQATLKDHKKHTARLQWIRGRGNRFRLECKIEELGEIALGQGDYPWLSGMGRAVFRGTLPPGAAPEQGPADPLKFADEQQLQKLKMAAALLAGLAAAPEAVEHLATFGEQPGENGTRVLSIARPGKRGGEVRLSLSADGAPLEARFDVEGTRGEVRFRGWQLKAAAHDSMFAPPAEPPTKEVAADDLYRMFAAAINFALENAE